MSVLKTPKRIKNWFKACGQIMNYADIPGYRPLSWPNRKKVDYQALWITVRSAAFWRGVLVVFAAVLLAHVLTWQFDLIGWQRDLLRCLPIALAAPGMAAMRRRLIEQLLKD